MKIEVIIEDEVHSFETEQQVPYKAITEVRQRIKTKFGKKCKFTIVNITL